MGEKTQTNHSIQGSTLSIISAITKAVSILFHKQLLQDKAHPILHKQPSLLPQVAACSPSLNSSPAQATARYTKDHKKPINLPLRPSSKTQNLSLTSLLDAATSQCILFFFFFENYTCKIYFILSTSLVTGPVITFVNFLRSSCIPFFSISGNPQLSLTCSIL